VQRDLYVAIVSRCWETDLAALASVVSQQPERLRYVGLMGSRRKVDRVRRELASRDIDLADVDLKAPIGLPIGGETPGELAVSILAEMIQVRSQTRRAAETEAEAG
jgi:xanthine dehydrogenase accessory factor